MQTVQLTGDKELLRALKALTGPRLRQVSTRSVRSGLKPLLASAKRLTPVHSGRLRASLGAEVKVRGRGASIQGKVGPRRDFRYTARGGVRRVAGQGKGRARAEAKGYQADAVSVFRYARVMEFGRDRSGRVRRRAGPAHFLTRALNSQHQQATSLVASGLRTHLR